MSPSAQQPDSSHQQVAPRRRRYKPPVGDGKGHRELVDHVAVVGIPAFTAIVGGLFLGLPGMLLGAALGYLVARAVVGAGRLVERSQAGTTTPHTPDYSVPESLVMQGEFTRAIESFEELVWASPDLPDPYVRIARLYRDKLDQAEEAERWFRRSRLDSRMPHGLDLLITQELIELYLHKLKTPRKAIPELAHLCSAHAGTPAAEAAEHELRELRLMLAVESEGGESVTVQYQKKHAPRRRSGATEEPT